MSLFLRFDIENESVDEKLLLHEAKCRYNHKVALDPVQCERCAAPWIIKECKSKFPNGGCGNPSVLGSCRPLELAGQSPTIDLFRTFFFHAGHYLREID